MSAIKRITLLFRKYTNFPPPINEFLIDDVGNFLNDENSDRLTGR